MSTWTFGRRPNVMRLATLGLVAATFAACGGGGGDDDGGGIIPPPNPPMNVTPPPTPLTPALPEGSSLPGVEVTINGVTGGTGAGGTFQPGDSPAVNFTIRRDDGSLLRTDDINAGSIMLCGPTSNYNRVIARRTDLRGAVPQTDGSYTYYYPEPIPANFIAPLNDTPSFGASDGELQGMPIVAGTYTFGIEMNKTYDVGSDTGIRDPGTTTFDVLMLGATTIEHREVVRAENCNTCHVEIQAHGRNRIGNVTHCLMCHNTGAEDRNVATAANGTPGVSIDFKVMIHKIHNGGHLPSVLGVTTDANGARNYAATPQPYQIVGNNNNVNDFSHVTFPVWPNLNIAMPRDAGYTALSTAARAQEDTIRTGAATCTKCHGDPDGSGPEPAPAQGDRYHTGATRAACGSCHDDIDWSHPYVSNTLMMPPQSDDASCNFCHESAGSLVNTADAHVHPINDPAINPGFTINLTAVTEGGTNNGNGKLDPGEKVLVTFNATDAAGAPVPASQIANLNGAISGPTTNRQLLLNTAIAVPILAPNGPWTIGLPENVLLEFAGDSTGALESFQLLRTPVWNVTGAATTVQVRTGATTSTTLATATVLLSNFLDVASPAGFARNDYVVLDDGVAGREEYRRIQTIQGNRLWLFAPIRMTHDVGAAVTKVSLVTKTATTDYTINTANGQITEVTEFGAGNAVIVSYTSDFLVPALHGPPLNDSPEVDETFGDWVGKTIVSGTYEVGLWGYRNVNLVLYGETNAYRAVTPPANEFVLVGTATTVTPNAIISSPSNCYSCHDDLYFHGGGRRGYETCLLCHGVSAAEDRPQYVAANAPATTETLIAFREMLHKIHAGEELANAATYEVVGFGGAAYPDNFSVVTYEEVGFPAFPSGVKDCEKCHGAGSSSWEEPLPRNHPTQQTRPTLAWRTACGSCHDDTAVVGHIKAQTSASGIESCAICHGPGQVENVALEHHVVR